MSPGHYVRYDTPHQPDDCSVMVKKNLGKPGDAFMLSPGDHLRRDTRRQPDGCMSCDEKKHIEKPGDGSRCPLATM